MFSGFDNSIRNRASDCTPNRCNSVEGKNSHIDSSIINTWAYSATLSGKAPSLLQCT